MKKIFLSLILLFCLTGCSINYELTIEDDQYQESTTVIEKDKTLWNEPNPLLTTQQMFELYIEKPIPLSQHSIIQSESNEKLAGVAYYTTKDLTDENQLGVNYYGEFTKDSIQDSTLINNAYNRFLVGTIDNNIILSTGEKCKLFEEYDNLDEVNIKITTNHKVVENNADEVNGNTYIWTVRKNNADNKPIYLEMSKDEYVDEGLTLSFWAKFAIAIGLLVVIVIVILIYIKIKNHKNNKL